jgi:hypothetical protein
MRTLVAACLVLVATIARADSSVPTKGAGAQLLTSIERTACYGRCPIYKVTGKATARLSAATVTQLVDAFTRADYFA